MNIQEQLKRLIDIGKKACLTDSAQIRLAEIAESQQQEIKKLNTAITAFQGEIDAERLNSAQLQTQNKLMWEALMCLPKMDGVTISADLCHICLHRKGCDECLIDKAIREGMGENV